MSSCFFIYSFIWYLLPICVLSHDYNVVYQMHILLKYKFVECVDVQKSQFVKQIFSQANTELTQLQLIRLQL